MSVKHKLFATCAGFALIIVLLGGLARQQTDRMRLLVTNIYDHAFVGILFAQQAQQQFLHFVTDADAQGSFSGPAQIDGLKAVMSRLDIAAERAENARTRAAGDNVRAALRRLPEVPAAERAARIDQARDAIDTLVKRFWADGLKARDDADDMALRCGRIVLAEMSLALFAAAGLGLLLGRNLSPPLEDLVRSIGLLTAGDLEHEVPARLARRRDEIGAVARATAFFRETMQKNIAAGEERVRLQAQTEAAQRAAERREAAMVAKSNFLATMSHEIRTPMNGVATIADLLAETGLNADQVKMVGIIRQSSKWLIRVVSDILDFSKMDAGQLHIERVPFMLDDVLEGACGVLSAKAEQAGLALVREGRDLPGRCRIGDPLRVRQVVLNLMGNAVKFTNQGSVTLALEALPDTIVLRITDTGIGIAAEKLDSLFQPYNQVRADIARSYGGTGLGLSISKNLVELMGGRISVASTPGQGTCFTVSLPLPSDAAGLCKGAARPAALAARWRKPDMAEAARHGAVILCAEDNDINRDVLARVLDRLGFNHEFAPDGEAALALLDRRRHGVILTDGQMPRLDGWQLAQAVRQQESDGHLPRLPILLLTANVLSETDPQTIAVGIDDVLTKPLDIAALESKLVGAVASLGTLRVAGGDGGDAPPPPAAPDGGGQGIDLSVLVQLVGDDPDTIRGLLAEFQAGVTAQFGQMAAARAANDAALIARYAHSIKGAARYAGAARLAEICDALERQAGGGESVDGLGGQLAALDAAMARLKQDVDAAMSGLKTAA
jgi:signal transduction histidine kinase/HPt (histidine-containing phosphotransfer) domain-containing protein/ActR/RegA family two-component response regulator